MSVFVVGSSHVRRLEQYIANRKELNNFNLKYTPRVTFYGISGGKITDHGHSQSITNFISANLEDPAHLIIHIGGNDLDSRDFTQDITSEIALRLVVFASSLQKRFGLKTVTVWLLPREVTRNVIPEQYNNSNKAVIETNKILKAELKKYEDIKYWNIKGVKQSANNFIDGVHFNNTVGMPKYFRNIRGAIAQTNSIDQ